MALIVQKYGGTSVGSVERIQAVAQRVQKTAQSGNGVVVVVSAMGKSTDELVRLAQAVSAQPSRREMDMLLSTGEQVSIALLTMALQELGQPAISLTGAQVGIVTEAEHSRARILEIKTERLYRHLNDSQVIVVAGFQGISREHDLEITTLGRGGSDTSAVALAAALNADLCEIYTDVPGILTTDPRLILDAQLMEEITCDEMLELASLGAKVLHPRAVEIAKNYGIPMAVRSSWTDDSGTRVLSPLSDGRSLNDLEIARPVDAIEFDPDQAKVALLRVPDCPGVAARLFGEIARQQVDVDLIIQSIHEGNSNDIAFTVVNGMLPQAEAVTEAIAPVLRRDSTNNDEAQVLIEQNAAKVSIIGAGMIGRPGVAAKMFQTLAEAGINIEMISTSEVKVSCVVPVEDGDRAIEALSEAFAIDSSPLTIVNNPAASKAVPVRGVALDQDQAQVGLRSVPDRPGMAAQAFVTLAKHGISVDTIIQSQRCRVVNGIATRDIAFTVAEAEAKAAQAILDSLATQLGWGDVVINTNIAKISIVGVGMVGQPGVAARFFGALAQEEINIQMIATSEIKISCVVAQEEGIKALQSVHHAFGLNKATSITATV